MYGATEIVYHQYLMNRPNRRIHYHVFSEYRYVFRIHFCVCVFRICDAGSRGSGSGDGGSRDSKWWRQTPFSGVMFKILLSKSNILNFELDEEGGVAEWDGPVDSSEAARTLHSHSRRCRVAAIVFVDVFVVLGGGVGGGSDSTVSRRR